MLLDNDAFGVARLTKLVNDIKFAPSRIEELKLFETDFIDTATVGIDLEGGGQIKLVPPTPRGGPGTILAAKKPDALVVLNVPHFEINDSILATEVQDKRQAGTEAELQTVAMAIAKKLKTARQSLSMTEEHARMGALKGVVSYADGSELDLFSTLGVTPAAPVFFDFAGNYERDGALRRICAGIVRRGTDALGGLPNKGFHAFCGDDFFDDLLTSHEVRATYAGWSESRILREGYVDSGRGSFGVFEFGGIVFENYRGTAGTTGFIGSDDCHIFPVGVPGLFTSTYAPADYVDTVNTIAERVYARQTPWRNAKGVSLDTQMNALQLCTRPQVLVTAHRGAAE